MLKQGLIEKLKTTEEFFNRSTSCLAEEDSSFAPKEELLTVAGQVAHVADTVEWCMDGMFNPKGFDMDFETHMKKVTACTSLSDARAWFKRAISNGLELLEGKSDEELQQIMPENAIMNGPRLIVIGAIADHTAHHRGTLTVYSRLLGKVPKMPYMDM